MRNRILAPLIAFVYWIWSHTWRLTVIENPEMKVALEKGPVVFAHWHGDEMVVLRLGRRYRCAAMTSTSNDGDLMTRVLKLFGFGISRGSSTRGGVRALVGMIKLLETGNFNGTVAVDGPKGPRHKPKPGVLQLAKHARTPIIPTGVARKSALVFHRSWNKTYIPWPFTRVVVSFGAPLYNVESTDELETRLHLQRGEAQSIILGGKNGVDSIGIL